MPKTFCKECGGIEADYDEVCHCGDSSIQSDLSGLAHEIWAVSQLTPSEGIEDGVARIIDVLKSSIKMDVMSEKIQSIKE